MMGKTMPNNMVSNNNMTSNITSNMKSMAKTKEGKTTNSSLKEISKRKVEGARTMARISKGMTNNMDSKSKEDIMIKMGNGRIEEAKIISKRSKRK